MSNANTVETIYPQIQNPKREETFREQRRRFIGGSDSAGVLGLSKWKTPYQVYLDKIGEGENKDSDAMHAGRLLERVIRQEYCDRYNKVVNTLGNLTMKEYPFIGANVDGVTLDNTVLEIKTSRYKWDEIPTEYYFQLQHYLLVTGYEHGELFALIAGQDFELYEVEADPKLHAEMIKIYKRFWDCVVNRIPPEIKTIGDVKLKYKEDNGSSIALSAKAETAIENIRSLNLSKASIEDRIEKEKLIVMDELGSCSEGVNSITGRTLCTWRNTKPRTYLDTARLKKEMPEVYGKYSTQSESSRRFVIKEIENEH